MAQMMRLASVGPAGMAMASLRGLPIVIVGVAQDWDGEERDPTHLFLSGRNPHTIYVFVFLLAPFLSVPFLPSPFLPSPFLPSPFLPSPFLPAPQGKPSKELN